MIFFYSRFLQIIYATLVRKTKPYNHSLFQLIMSRLVPEITTDSSIMMLESS